MLKFLKVSALVSFLATFVLAFFYPALFSIIVFAIITLVVAAILSSFKIEPVQHRAPPPDDDDSLEDDIRHHDYGYPGFGTEEDERH
jgi:hypothetical protein